VIQVCDLVENLIGGAAAGDLMISGGWAICHRAGSAYASRRVLDSTPDRVDLRGLRTGEVAILLEGRLVEFPAQIRYVSPVAIAGALQGHVALEVPGTDWRTPGRMRPMDTLLEDLTTAVDNDDVKVWGLDPKAGDGVPPGLLGDDEPEPGEQR